MKVGRHSKRIREERRGNSKKKEKTDLRGSGRKWYEEDGEGEAE